MNSERNDLEVVMAVVSLAGVLILGGGLIGRGCQSPPPEPVCTQWTEQDVHIIECKARDSGRCTQWTDERIERRTVCVK